jgi:ketosteroid isomerase-like protein
VEELDMQMLAWLVSVTLGVVAPAESLRALAPQPSPEGVVEIRSYNLKPGTRERFHRLFVNEGLPLLRRWKVDVVAYGPSLHDNDSYFLIRAFDGLGERQTSEDAFYGSEEWKQGPRERVLADIDSYTTIVVRLDAATLKGLRNAGGHAMPGTAPNDLETLTKLNEEYIRSVQQSDVKRFDEILANDFLCSMPDGSLLDRKAFLDYAAKPVTIRNIHAHEVNVRLMGDVAIVHARTAYIAADGTPGGGRYTDVWARRDGRWLAVSAHVTRK